jgi:hypothetical protein
MKNPALLLGLILFCAPVLAQDTAQDKLKACEARRKGKQEGKDSTAEKMKKCSADAKETQGRPAQEIHERLSQEKDLTPVRAMRRSLRNRF